MTKRDLVSDFEARATQQATPAAQKYGIRNHKAASSTSSQDCGVCASLKLAAVAPSGEATN
jgi:hypothetical protein